LQNIQDLSWFAVEPKDGTRQLEEYAALVASGGARIKHCPEAKNGKVKITDGSARELRFTHEVLKELRQALDEQIPMCAAKGIVQKDAFQASYERANGSRAEAIWALGLLVLEASLGGAVATA
jgi:hypothetical protein